MISILLQLAFAIHQQFLIFFSKTVLIFLLLKKYMDQKINCCHSKYVSNFEKSNAIASLLLCEVNNPSQFVIAEMNNVKKIRTTEKQKNPATTLPISH